MDIVQPHREIEWNREGFAAFLIFGIFAFDEVRSYFAAHKSHCTLLQQQLGCKMAGIRSTCKHFKKFFNFCFDCLTLCLQKDLTKLEELLFVGNPLYEAHQPTDDFRINVAGRLPWLKKLDGTPVDDDERERGKALVG